MKREKFYREHREQSEIKTAIVGKYFWAWSRIVAKRSKRVAYIDFFAGQGRFDDGYESTPLVVLRQAIADDLLRERLVTIFNDADPECCRKLKAAVKSLPGVTKLKHTPLIENDAVGDELVKTLPDKLIPSIIFLDPWGYKGISLELIRKLLAGWGCDVVLFFNYARVNPGIRNPRVREHMDALLGPERVEALAKRLDGMAPGDREAEVVDTLSRALVDVGAQFVLPLCFKNKSGKKTTHHLIFATKNQQGYQIMKDIMAKECRTEGESVPSFVFNPATRRQKLLFEYTRPLKDLERMLLKHFAGQKLTVKQIFLQHNVGRPFVSGNYKEALLSLEGKGKIKVDPSREKRRARKGKPTMSDKAVVTFPKE